jgi:glycosyltransferase involved in cell wall biosynthesis
MSEAVPIRVALWADINMNLMDGSSLWLQSIAMALARGPSTELTILLKDHERSDLLTAPLKGHEQMTLVYPSELGLQEGRLDASRALDALERMDDEQRFDLLILRGGSALREVAGRDQFDGRLWLYYVPGFTEHRDLRQLMPKAHRILCQGWVLPDPLVRLAADSPSTAVLMPPILPPIRPADQPPKIDPAAPKLIFAGTLSRQAGILETVKLHRLLRSRHRGAELQVAGDKIPSAPGFPFFRQRVRRALKTTRGLIWHGAVPREEVHELTRRCDVAVSSFDPARTHPAALLSTKVLEYSATRRPVLLTRIPLYERLLGPDYPLFADDPREGVRALEAAMEDPSILRAAAETCFRASQPYSFSAVAQRLSADLNELTGGRASDSVSLSRSEGDGH